MTPLSRKILDNRRRQHDLVTIHKRRIRDEVRPRLQSVKRDWNFAACENNRMIRERWQSQKSRVRSLQRAQKIRHKATILAHRKRIRAEIAARK